MIHVMDNKYLHVTVDELGAELASIADFEGHEYLWQGSTESWTGRSPVLFPIIGGLPDDRYTVDGREFEMASHGFARKRPWSLVGQESSSAGLTFQLKSNEETRAIYPFDFDFRIDYQLEENVLAVGFDILNTGHDAMPFSVGGHPGFHCPLEENLAFEDYQLRFDSPVKTQRYLKEGKLLTGATEPFTLPDGILKLNHDLFKRGAIILRGISFDSVILECPGKRRAIKVEFSGFPDLGLWTYPSTPAPFICIEPWFGVDSTKNLAGDGDLKRKTGIVTLKPGERHLCRYTITIY